MNPPKSDTKYIEEIQNQPGVTPARRPIKLQPGEVATPPWPTLDGEPPEGYRWQTDKEFAAYLRGLTENT